jgi:hypothetical protein
MIGPITAWLVAFIGDESAGCVPALSPDGKERAVESTPLFDEESLRLLKAFFKIRDAEARGVVIRTAELLASGVHVTVTEASGPGARTLK